MLRDHQSLDETPDPRQPCDRRRNAFLRAVWSRAELREFLRARSRAGDEEAEAPGEPDRGSVSRRSGT